jgi:hypothetical protein
LAEGESAGGASAWTFSSCSSGRESDEVTTEGKGTQLEVVEEGRDGALVATRYARFSLTYSGMESAETNTMEWSERGLEGVDERSASEK